MSLEKGVAVDEIGDLGRTVTIDVVRLLALR